MVGEPKTHREEMNKQIVGIIMGIFLISLASALTYNVTAGESYSFNLSEHYTYYEISGNTTPVDMNVTHNGTNILITPSRYMSGTFAITFYAEKEVEEETGSSGGGCRTTWECTEWGNCINGNQTRTCSKVRSYCYAPRKDKPSEFQECEVQKDSEGTEEEIINLEPEEKKKAIWPYFFWGVFILAIILMWYKAFKKIKKNKNDNSRNTNV